MFVFNVKVSASKKTAFLIAFGTVLCAIICIICMLSMHKITALSTATCDEIGTYSLNAENAEEQCSFFEQFNIEADIKSARYQKVIIPSVFNSYYKQYNAIQNKIGLDLNRYSGKEVKKITYKLNNAKTKYAVMLVYDKKVIGVHLTNGEYGQSNLPLI